MGEIADYMLEQCFESDDWWYDEWNELEYAKEQQRRRRAIADDELEELE